MVPTNKKESNLVSLCISWRAEWRLCDSYITVFYTNDIISELSGHHSALDCITQSDLGFTYAKRDIFTGYRFYERITTDEKLFIAIIVNSVK